MYEVEWLDYDIEIETSHDDDYPRDYVSEVEVIHSEQFNEPGKALRFYKEQKKEFRYVKLTQVLEIHDNRI